jgi:hypothetical protein
MRALLLHLKYPLATSALALAAAYAFLGGARALVTVFVLIILEVSLSFDNAVVNAKILGRMSETWQRIFLTVGILIAVFGMRLIFPLFLVCVTAHIGPVEVLMKAVAGGSVETVGTYGYLLNQAHPTIAAFGGLFLLMLALDWLFEDREIKWLSWLEKPLAQVGKLARLSTVIALAALIAIAKIVPEHTVPILLAGLWGIIIYILVNGLGSYFESKGLASGHQKAVGKAGFFLFTYLEVLDAGFSFDGVIGAFAISTNIFVIMLGLGTGALFIRSFTTYLVHTHMLEKFRFLEHGAHWAIMALAVIMLISLKIEVSEIITGLIGAVLIALSVWHSAIVNKRRKWVRE